MNPTCNGKDQPHPPAVMAKAGFSWSGTKKIQRFKCAKCGRVTTTLPKDKPKK